MAVNKFFEFDYTKYETPLTSSALAAMINDIASTSTGWVNMIFLTIKSVALFILHWIYWKKADIEFQKQKQEFEKLIHNQQQDDVNV